MLKIIQEVYRKIVLGSPLVPPESGGILGGVNGVILEFMRDEGLVGNLYDEYLPDVEKMNHKICQWQADHIDFYGIYHCHFPGGVELSRSDQIYIGNILRAVPCKWLYFPIVFPQKTMIAWKAVKSKENFNLLYEKIEKI